MSPAHRALAAVAAFELLLARASGGPLPWTDVAAAAAGWVVFGLTAVRWPWTARCATAAVAAGLLVAPASDAGVPGLALLAGLALALPPSAPAHLTAVSVAAGAAAVLDDVPFTPLAVAVTAALVGFAPARWVPPAGLALALASVLPTPRPPGPHPDVLLITVDALRADRGPTMATWRHLADAGRAWPDARTPAPWTLPALAALLTGVEDHGAGRVPGGFTGPRPDLPRLAADVPVESVAISGGNVFTGATFGLLDGFDRAHHPWAPATRPLPRGRSRHAPSRPLFSRWQRAPATQDPDAVDAARRALAAPWPSFVWLHLMGVHLPWPDAPCRPDVLSAPGARPLLLDDPWWTTAEGRACLSAGYDAAVARVDASLWTLVSGLDLDRTVVVLTADHGEALGEAGLEHGHTFDASVIGVPLAIAGPLSLPEPRGPVDLLDVHATLRGLYGLPPVGPGRDLRGPLRPRELTPADLLYPPPPAERATPR